MKKNVKKLDRRRKRWEIDGICGGKKSKTGEENGKTDGERRKNLDTMYGIM